MFSALHRLVPFFSRKQKGGVHQLQSKGNQGREVALTQQQCSDSEAASEDGWSTVERGDIDEFKKGTRFNASSSRIKSSRSSHRFIMGAISHLPFRQLTEFVVNEDISNGRERNKIPALSYKRHDKAPEDYHYVTEHVSFSQVNIDVSLGNMSSCECSGDCSGGKCRCSSNQEAGIYYNSKGYLSSSYNVDSPNVIYECNSGCKCNRKTCRNTVIQEGSKVRVVLFRTCSRGWGIRTLENLKRGTFIGIYSGELLAAADSQKRKDDTYLFNLANTHIYYTNQQPQTATNDSIEQRHQSDPSSTQNESAGEQQQQVVKQQQQDEQWVCDAKFYGNFTRFINHSCEPNVIGIRSFTVHQDNRFPYIAFFTNQEIKANSELTLNYGDNYWLVKCKRDGVYCLCKRPHCRFNKKVFPETFRQQREQRRTQREHRQQQQQQ